MLDRRIALVSLIGLLATSAGILGCGDDDADGNTSTGGQAPGGAGGMGGSDPTGGRGGTGAGGQGAAGSGGSGAQAVTIDVEAHVGAAPFDCTSTYPGLGTAGTEVGLSDFRFYVTDVRLLEVGTGAEVAMSLTQDGLWQHTADGASAGQGVALLDFEDGAGSCLNGTSETNTSIVGSVPEGEYDGIKFVLGVPHELNHADVATAPSPLNLSAMFWNWNGGYKFLRVDSSPVASPDPFNMHLGSTMCMGDPELGEVVTCGNPNRTEVELAAFDASTDVIVFDYAALVANSDLTVNQVGAPGCQSMPTDTDCVEPFAAIGIDHTNGSLLGTQAVFHVE